jgi:hypothetical protein
MYKEKTDLTYVSQLKKTSIFVAKKLISLNHVVFVSGETATFDQTVSPLEKFYNIPFERILWNNNTLANPLKDDPENIFLKYCLLFTDPRVSKPMEQTFNFRNKLPTVVIHNWLAINIPVVE